MSQPYLNTTIGHRRCEIQADGEEEIGLCPAITADSELEAAGSVVRVHQGPRPAELAAPGIHFIVAVTGTYNRGLGGWS